MTDASGTANYTYDSLDRLTAKATPVNSPLPCLAKAL
ncbi:MAG: hypothetical protein JSS95_01255 [Acidobacteria bacterium]|nr:hypothetical protein [Acidobacteriota bacterium]